MIGAQTPPANGKVDARRDLENKVRKHPDDQDAKVDLGSDESMDASDPIAVIQPGHESEPVPSSGFPEAQDEESSDA